jgi:hypothetical protein
MNPDPLLHELQAPDPRSLRFNHIGFGSALSPEDAARHQARAIADAQLVDAVPGAILENFERARKLHLYGVLEYEFFTAAADYALLVLEAALRVRFLSYYDHRVPVCRGGQPIFLEVGEFDEVFAAKGIKLRRGEAREPFPKYLRALLKWARAEALLPGRRSQIVDAALVELRNHAAHPTGRAINGPPESSRTLRDVAEYINCLWGVRTREGRLFGRPLCRRPRVAAVGPNGSTAEMELHHVPDVPLGERSWAFTVFLAAGEEELILPFRGLAYEEGFEATMYPCQRLWTGTWEELAGKVAKGEFLGLEDEIEPFDRIFFLRLGAEGPACSPQALTTLSSVSNGPWLAIVADTPQEALCHVRDHEPMEGHSCPQCFVEVQGPRRRLTQSPSPKPR